MAIGPESLVKPSEERIPEEIDISKYLEENAAQIYQEYRKTEGATRLVVLHWVKKVLESFYPKKLNNCQRHAAVVRIEPMVWNTILGEKNKAQKKKIMAG